MLHHSANGLSSVPARLLVFSFLVSCSIRTLQSQASLPTDDESAFKQETDQYEKEFDRLEKAGGRNQAFFYDLSPLAKRLVERMHSAHSPAERQTAALLLAVLRDYEVSLPASTYEEIAALVPPGSSLWATHPDAIALEAEALKPEASHTFLTAMQKENPDRLVQGRATIALVQFALRRHDSSAYEKEYAYLSTSFADVKELKFDVKRLNPQNKTAIGKKAASFELPALDPDRDGKISNKTFAGKYYLIDFWASWCGPCLGERASLQHAFERFGNRNFAIVSISLDETPDAALLYQKKRWSMPWANAFLPGGQKSPTARDFDVDWMGLPVLLLVSPDGTIAESSALGRFSLQATLEHYLESPARNP